MAPFSIAGMTAENLPQVAAIEERVTPHPWSLSQFRESLDSHHCLVSVNRDGAVAGYLIFSRVTDESEVLNIAVSPDFQRRGLASRLLNHFLSALPDQVKTVFLEVRASNRAAICLYNRFGFVQTGCRKNYYLMRSGKREDALLLSYRREP